jgi:hypothetical protein
MEMFTKRVQKVHGSGWSSSKIKTISPIKGQNQM